MNTEDHMIPSGTSFEVQCQPGLVPTQMTATCNKGRWLPEEPECEARKQTEPSEIDDIDVVHLQSKLSNCDHLTLMIDVGQLLS